MEYVSERITNISELEKTVREARANMIILESEIHKAEPSIADIDRTASLVTQLLEKAEQFEFCIEKRVCHFTKTPESQTYGENLSAICNPH